MRLDEGADLDTSHIRDLRGSGGGGPLGGRVALGGGSVSVVGLILYLLVSVRHEAPGHRAEVEGLRRWVVAAA